MKIKRLKVRNYRALDDTEIIFRPGFNLIVGVNGAGKSSLLDAVRINMNQLWPNFFGKKSPKTNLGFDVNDIQINKDFLTTELELNFNDESYKYKIIKYLTDVPNRNSSTLTDSESQVFKSHEVNTKNLPLFLFLSVDRSRATNKVTTINKNTHSGWSEVFNKNRGLNIQEIASWFAVKSELAKENTSSLNYLHITILNEVLSSLLPEYHKWDYEMKREKDKPVTYDLIMYKNVKVKRIDKEGNTFYEDESRKLYSWQLSDGERSIISIIFDISRRLILLNPDEKDPISKASGIVLIDEIDLHLHPRWQRELTKALPRIFKDLQFICTTHSPQVIGETPTNHVYLLDNKGKVIVQPESFGRRTEWILKHIMGGTERNIELKESLTKIEMLIDEGELEEAEKQLVNLLGIYGPDPDIIENQTIIDRLINDTWNDNEMDK